MLAQRRGIRFLTLDSSSTPILGRHARYGSSPYSSSSASSSSSRRSSLSGGSGGSPSLLHSATLALASLLEDVVSEPRGPSVMDGVSAYLAPLTPPLLTALVVRISTNRPLWVPLEYHWAPMDHDPLLALLEAVGVSLQQLIYTCHPLSREALHRTLTAMPNLITLKLSHGADDQALRIVGATCVRLQVLSLRGSKAVTDDGMRRLLLRRSAYMRNRWRQLFGRWRELRLTLSASYRPLQQGAPGQGLDPEVLNAVAGTLTELDLRGTRVTSQGVAWVRSVLPTGATVVSTACPSAAAAFRLKVSRQNSIEDQLVRLLHIGTP
ncbi:uncharacterized protein LOC143038687 [Oratosquilla oratoria]|uniref:uncharacterized protein LOC143038687 n=1 Tax=Oratosquilla oratoria TaxID=337810 RepID=UPI003F761F5A